MNIINWLATIFLINDTILQSCCDKLLDKKWEALRAPLLRKRALELTKKQILNVLGMEQFPSRGVHRRRTRPHTYMLDIYKTLSRGAKKWKSKRPTRGIINTVRGLVDQEVYDRSLPQKNHQLYVFDLSSIPQKDQVIAAELRILRRPVIENAPQLIAEYGTVFRAVIHMRKRTRFTTSQTPYKYTGLEPVDSFNFDITESVEKWNVLSVSKALHRWQHSTSKIHYLQLTVQSTLNGKYVSPVALGFSKDKRAHMNRALLVVFTNDGQGKIPTKLQSKRGNADSHWIDVSHSEHELDNEKKSRTKRRTKRRRRKYECRVKSLWVDFNKLEWGDWIIAPNGYEAGICEGVCKFPLDEHLRPSNHATVQTIVNTVDPSAAPPVCCVPNKLVPLSILYNDALLDTFVYKKYENMSVKRCGCS